MSEKQITTEPLEPTVDERIRIEQVSLLAGGMRPENIDMDKLRDFAEGKTSGFTMIDAREIHADPPKRSLFDKAKGFLMREQVIEGAWTESAEEYNTRLAIYDPQTELSETERGMIAGDYAEYVASGGHAQTFNPYGPLADAYARQTGAPEQGYTQIVLPRLIEADPGTTVIHRDGPPPPPQQPPMAA